jgi:hypothetical protein
MSYCTPCPPCDTEFPLLCEPLETTANGKRLVVEDSAACQKTIQTPVAQQVLKTDGAGNLTWTNGDNTNVLKKSPTGLVEFGKVETDYIADNAVTTSKIIDGAVVGSKIPDKTITNAKLRDSSALSVIGRSASSTGDVADITSSANGQFLRRSSNVLGFGAIIADDLPAGTVLNAKFYESSTEYTVTSIIPFDNTIPQITEGTQIISGTITPTKTTSRIVGFVSINGDADSTSVQTIVAAFRGTTANAVAATWLKYITYSSLISFEFTDLPNTTSATTYSIRVGPDTGTLYVNRQATAPTSLLGGANKITLTLLEINPS